MEACQNPDILRIILFISQILDIVFIIVPIGLIVMIGLDFFKNVTSSKEDEMKKNLQIAIKRIIYCICIFFVPTVVNLVNNLVSSVLEDTSINYAECLTNANTEKIEELINQQANTAYETALSEQTMSQVLEAETAINKMKDGASVDGVTKETMLSNIGDIKEKLIAEQKEKEEEEQSKSSSSYTTSGTSSASGSSSSSEFENYGSGGTSGDYFSPIQGISSFTTGSYGSTSGCSNSVYHDISGISAGTPIYAGMDGTAEFYQWTTTQNGKTVLASYGNVIILTASNGTYIIYAHLQGFAASINTPVSSTCTYPCSASNYSITKNKIDTKTVKKGDLIGYLGTTGNSTGPHLHVEIHENGGKSCVTNPWKAFGLK